MALTKLTADMNNHQSLPDKPALSAEELQILFDKAPNDIKDFINQILIAELDKIVMELKDGKINVDKIINDLTTGGATNVASAEMVKQLETNKMDKTEVQTELAKKSDVGHTHTKANITDFSHTHDDRYYTESEMNEKLNGKANSSHTHTNTQISGLKTGATTQITTGSSAPSGGSNGDVYIQYF